MEGEGGQPAGGGGGGGAAETVAPADGASPSPSPSPPPPPATPPPPAATPVAAVVPAPAINKGLVDYFVVSGLDPEVDFAADQQLGSHDLDSNPLNVPYAAHVLHHVPETCPWNQPFDPRSAIMLCFPRGLRFKRERDNRRIKFHTFVLTKDDGSHVYGASLTFHEEVTDSKLLMAMEMLLAMYQQQKACDASPVRGRPRSYMERPPSPMDAAPDFKKNKLYAPKSLCLLSQIPAVACFEQYLRQLFVLAKEENVPVALEAVLANLIYEVPMPPKGKSVQFACSKPLVCRRSGPGDLPMLEYSIRRLFTLFKPGTILDLLACCLLEKQIILKSNDYELLVMTAECLTALMYPFSWQHVYVPILPSNLLHFLEAPMPFIMGLHVDMASDVEVECVVEINTGTVNLPEDMPEFPFKERLVAALGHILEDSTHSSSGLANVLALNNAKALHALQSGSALPASPNNPGSEADFRFTTAVRSAFLEVFVELFFNYETFVILPEDTAAWIEGTTVDDDTFDRMAFLSDQPKYTISFLSEMLETQLFTSFVEGKIFSLATQAAATRFDIEIQARREREQLELGAEPPSPHKELPKTPGEDGKVAAIDKPVECDLSIPSPAAAASPSKGAKLRRGSPKGPRRTSPKTPRRSSSRGSATLAAKEGGAGRQASSPRLPRKPTHERIKQRSHSRSPQPGRNKLDRKAESNGSKTASKTLSRKRSLPVLPVAPPPPLSLPASPQTGRALFCKLDASFFGPDKTHAPWTTSGRKKGRTHRRKPSEDRRLKTGRRRTGRANMQITSTESDSESHTKFIRALMNECAAKVKKTVVAMMSSATASSLGHIGGGGGVENTLVASLCDLMERMFKHGLRSSESKSAIWSCVSHCLPTLSQSCAEDFRAVEGMSFLRSDIGRARAWIRLCIEKKSFSSCLEEAFRNKEVLDSLYKPYAFLAHEDVREQLVNHLLSLTAVNFSCFSVNYPGAVVKYRVSIVTGRKFRAGTTANVSVTVRGEHSSVGPIERAKDPSFNTGCTHTFEVEHSNLGPITSVLLAHDSTGMFPAWLVDRVTITNLLTSSEYMAQCGHRLEKCTDGTLSQLELTVQTDGEEECPEDNESEPSQPGAITALDPLVIQAQDAICRSLANSVNAIVRHFYLPEQERSLAAQATLLLGTSRLVSGSSVDITAGLAVDEPQSEHAKHETALCQALLAVFEYGFKSKTMFGASRHVWDFLDKAHNQIRNTELASDPEALLFRTVEHANAMSCPKAARFEFFVCAGATHHLWHVWIELLANAASSSTLYDATAIFRDPKHVSTLMEMLRYLVEFPFDLQGQLLYQTGEDKSALGKWKVLNPQSAPAVRSPEAEAAAAAGKRSPTPAGAGAGAAAADPGKARAVAAVPRRRRSSKRPSDAMSAVTSSV